MIEIQDGFRIEIVQGAAEYAGRLVVRLADPVADEAAYAACIAVWSRFEEEHNQEYAGRSGAPDQGPRQPLGAGVSGETIPEIKAQLERERPERVERNRWN